MKIDQFFNPLAILNELSVRLCSYRQSQNLTQTDLAKAAGVGKRTIERIEAGMDTQLSTLFKIMSALDLTKNLEQLIPNPKISPVSLLKEKKQKK